MTAPLPNMNRVAILSLHSHGDRSFLDDAQLALLSGDLRADGIDNDLVVAVLNPSAAETGGDPVEERLAQTLSNYQIVVYERVWSPAVIERLRERLPGRTFIWCRGEHTLDDPPADWIGGGDLRQSLPVLIGHIRGEIPHPPAGARRRVSGRWEAPLLTTRPAVRERAFAPNVRPVVVNPEDITGLRIFSIDGNVGCPYQSDARENPLYSGVTMPEGIGRGCAFCTTGNKYEGHPNEQTAAFVLQQIRYLKRNAPELEHIVLKDQNPFGYLPAVIDGCATEGLTPLVLMLQTRADWFVRNLARFERALDVARTAGIRVSPFLVGIENFSQRELDRFNKGMTAEENVSFLDALWRWRDTHADVIDLTHASFGFILLSPWTTMEDLAINLEGIRRTKLDRLRGRLLVSRARLYPDTALYYLAQRDGLLIDAFTGAHEDNSRRFGYYPSQPWRYQDPAVARFSEIAALLDDRAGARDELALFECLLDAFGRTTDFDAIDAEAIWQKYLAKSGATRRDRPGLRERFARLVSPLPIESAFASGWSIDDLAAQAGGVRVKLTHADESPVLVELAMRGPGPRRARSRHYDIRALNGQLTPGQEHALSLLCAAIVRNDA